MFLVDTNIWLERLLDQERSGQVGLFLDRMPSENLFISDFSFHSIGIVMSRLNHNEAFLDFVHDILIHGAIVLIRLEPDDMQRLTHVMGHLNLDFDDSYQYVAAEKNGLTIVSFDADFERTERGRKTPSEVLQDSIQ